MIRGLAGLIVAATLCACATKSSTASRADPQEAKRAIDSTNAKIVNWFRAGHADSAAELFATDVRQMPPNMPALVGRDSLRAFWMNAVKTGKWDFNLTSDEVITCDSLAVERGRYTLKVVAGPQAKYPSFEDRGNYVVLWRREGDGRWRIVWDAPVSVVPQPMPAASAPVKKA